MKKALSKLSLVGALGALLTGCGPQMIYEVQDLQQTREASDHVQLSVGVQCLVMHLDDKDCSRLGEYCVEARWAQAVPGADGGTTVDYDHPLDTARTCGTGTLATDAVDTVTLTSSTALPKPPGLKLRVEVQWPNHVGQVGSPSDRWEDGQ